VRTPHGPGRTLRVLEAPSPRLRRPEVRRCRLHLTRISGRTQAFVPPRTQRPSPTLLSSTVPRHVTPATLSGTVSTPPRCLFRDMLDTRLTNQGVTIGLVSCLCRLAGIGGGVFMSAIEQHATRHRRSSASSGATGNCGGCTWHVLRGGVTWSEEGGHCGQSSGRGGVGCLASVELGGHGPGGAGMTRNIVITCGDEDCRILLEYATPGGDVGRWLPGSCKKRRRLPASRWLRVRIRAASRKQKGRRLVTGTGLASHDRQSTENNRRRGTRAKKCDAAPVRYWQIIQRAEIGERGCPGSGVRRPGVVLTWRLWRL
jgi:hypothetical protein